MHSRAPNIQIIMGYTIRSVLENIVRGLTAAPAARRFGGQAMCLVLLVNIYSPGSENKQVRYLRMPVLIDTIFFLNLMIWQGFEPQTYHDCGNILHHDGEKTDRTISRKD